MDSPWSNVPRLLHLAETYRAIGNYPAALSALRDALTEDPENLDALLAYVHTLLDAEDIDAAEQTLHAVRAVDPDDARGHVATAMVYLNRKELGPAQSACDRAIAQDPEVAIAHFVRGLILKAFFQWDDAEASLTKALELEPSSTWAAVELARLKLDRKDFAGAQAILAEIDTEGMSNPHYVLLMGELALEERKLEEAFDRALWVLQNEPDNGQAIKLLANVKFAQSRFKALPFRLVLWVDRLPVWMKWVLGLAGSGVFIFGATAWRDGVENWLTLTCFLVPFAFMIFVISRDFILELLVKRELRSVRLKEF